jgi:cytochrome c-type biogenesis protein CcmH
MTTRREFLSRAAAGAVSVAFVVPTLRAQDTARAKLDTTNLFAMDQNAARTVRRPPKPGARPSMSRDERDALEHRIRCQCGCTLDVYTCRTTDFSCKVSPAMHRDVLALVEGGYGGQEIIDAFVGTYGERALMAPSKSGFNLIGWLTPGIVFLFGGAALFVLLRRWGSRSRPEIAPLSSVRTDATPDELARIDAAVRADDR